MTKKFEMIVTFDIDDDELTIDEFKNKIIKKLDQQIGANLTTITVDDVTEYDTKKELEKITKEYLQEQFSKYDKIKLIKI